MEIEVVSLDLSALKTPFKASDIEWRVQSAGEKNGKAWASVLAYVTNRAIMDRLDEVVGPANWKNEYSEAPGGGVLCGISININGQWVTKYDGAENTQIEAVKGGLSGAMKRAAVQWGIGRYLYSLKAGFANISKSGEHYQGAKPGKYQSFKWDAPSLPAWALPEGEVPAKPKKKEAVKPAEKPAEKDYKAMLLGMPEVTEDQVKLDYINKLTEVTKFTYDRIISKIYAEEQQAGNDTKELDK